MANCELCGKKVHWGDTFCDDCWNKKQGKIKARTKDKKDYESKLSGIGGWLLLVAIGLYFSAIIYLYTLFAPEYTFLMKVLYVIGAGIHVYTIVLMHKRKKDFKKWTIFTLWYPAIEVVIVSLVTLEPYEAGAFLLGMIIYIIPIVVWTLYIKKSIRVKNTFTK